MTDKVKVPYPDETHDFLAMARDMCAAQDDCEDCPVWTEGRCQLIPSSDGMDIQELIDEVWLWKVRVMNG